MNDSLKTALAQAICYGEDFKDREGGGVLMVDRETNESFSFIPITNSMAATNRDKYLYVADKDEYGKKVIPLIISCQFKPFASFHTHPGNCSTDPSYTDVSKLFMGFPINYIYSPTRKQLSCYEKMSNDEVRNIPRAELVLVELDASLDDEPFKIAWKKTDITL